MRNTFAKQGYLQVLTWVSQQPHFTNKDLLARFPVSKSLIYDMHKLMYIKKLEKCVYKWNLDRDPKVSDVNALRRKANGHNRLSKKIPKQLTIEPLTRVERIAPVRQPVQELQKQHTPYPIMDIVIAFLSGMIAAGFISLIWK
jgi:hypothetical protein